MVPIPTEEEKRCIEKERRRRSEFIPKIAHIILCSNLLHCNGVSLNDN